MNNEIRDWQNKLVGFKCINCGIIYESGWGNNCNKCRNEERKHKEILQAIKTLTQR